MQAQAVGTGARTSLAAIRATIATVFHHSMRAEHARGGTPLWYRWAQMLRAGRLMYASAASRNGSLMVK